MGDSPHVSQQVRIKKQTKTMQTCTQIHILFAVHPLQKALLTSFKTWNNLYYNLGEKEHKNMFLSNWNNLWYNPGEKEIKIVYVVKNLNASLWVLSIAIPKLYLKEQGS